MRLRSSLRVLRFGRLECCEPIDEDFNSRIQLFLKWSSKRFISISREFSNSKKRLSFGRLGTKNHYRDTCFRPLINKKKEGHEKIWPYEK